MFKYRAIDDFVKGSKLFLAKWQVYALGNWTNIKSNENKYFSIRREAAL